MNAGRAILALAIVLLMTGCAILALAIVLLAGCASSPAKWQAPPAVHAACVPPDAMPGVPVIELYRQCRDAVFAPRDQAPPAWDLGPYGLPGRQ